MYIQVLGRSLPFPLAVVHDRHDLTTRAALPADSPSPSEPSSLLPLLALTLVFVLVAFGLARLFKRFNPNLSLGLRLPNYRWLRGKGQGAKGRLGLGGVELLPTSVKSIPTPSPSPRVGVFAGSSNVGKDSDTSGLLSRSSSLDTLPQYPDTATPPPTAPFPVHARHVNNPFKFSIFPTSKSRNRGKSASHRRSRSLGVPIRHLAVPSSPLASVNGGSSAPTTPSPQALLIDFSSSSESASSGDSSGTTSSKEPSSSSSDLGTHRFSPGSDGPLIPIPIPAHHDPPSSTSHVWAFDLDMDEEQGSQPTNPLMQAFKRSQANPASNPISPIPLIVYDSSSPPARSAALPTPALLSTSISHNSDSSHTPSSPEFPLTPPGLSTFPRMGDHVRMASMLSSNLSNALSSPISSDFELTSIGRHSPASSDLRNSDEKLVELENSIDQDIELVDIGEPRQLVDYVEESHFDAVTADNEVWTQPILDFSTADVRTTMDVPKTSPTVEDPPVLVALHSTPNSRPSDLPVQSRLSDEPISVTVEPPTPMPYIEVPLVDTTRSVDQSNASEIPGPMILVPDIRSPSPAPHQEQLVEVSDVPVPRSGQVSPVGTMEAWSWDDAWNLGAEPEIVDEVQLPEHQTTETDVDTIRSDTIPQPVVENFDATIDNSVDEEAWFLEEPTAVWADEEPVDAVVIIKEKMMQEVDLPPNAFFEQPESSLCSIHVPEPDMLMLQKLEVQKPDSHDHDQKDENSKTHDNVMNVPVLEPLSIPLITISVEEFPDPGLLPLPSRPVSPTNKPEVKSYPSQTPTPPASPPASPSRSLPVSALSSPNTTSPVALPSSTSSTPTSARPAWSLRASDAPALGIPSPSGLKQRSSPDLRSRNRMLSPVTEQQTTASEGSAAQLTDDSIPVQDDSAIKDDIYTSVKGEAQIESTKPDEETPETILSELSTTLPGSFPISQPTEDVSDSPAPSAQSTAVATTTAPRRRTTRSPLDIALAMQLRPGLGVGADPAWMVRFLMSMFGWFAILLSGQAEFDGYRNGSYPIGH